MLRGLRSVRERQKRSVSIYEPKPSNIFSFVNQQQHGTTDIIAF